MKGGTTEPNKGMRSESRDRDGVGRVVYCRTSRGKETYTGLVTDE